MIDGLMDDFRVIFGADRQDGAAYFSPAKVNLIGGHTDYNGGHVFPAALTLGIYAIARKREDRIVNFYSKNYIEDGIVEFSLDEELEFNSEDDGVNYVKGMYKYILEYLGADSANVVGADIIVHGNIPSDSGLGSSASIEMLIAKIACDTSGIEMEPLTLAKLGRRVENEFIGHKSGIMDQFAIEMGKKDMVILLNAGSMKYEYVPAEFGNYSILIMCTNKLRRVKDSAYNVRQQQCQEALAILKQKADIENLCDLSYAAFLKLSYLIDDETLLMRARHVITENERVLEAKETLEAKDLNAFGALLYSSHCSLRDDYEVTGVELDTLVELAIKQKGVLGARMTGAGFGGSAIALIKDTEIHNFILSVAPTYQRLIGYSADFFIARISDGVHNLDD
ncbi:MAG: galactokinase [Clostridiales Family XIII bacterium]|jgi:galactokinase|nr:galactokinase [Clostridiales Family XIII bacterium]